MRSSDTRDALIRQGLKSILAYGYAGAGIGPVLSAVRVPKGSFYHFFRSKEHFAIAVLEAYSARYARSRESLLADSAGTPLQRLRSYFDQLEKQLIAEYPSGGCLYGVLSQTIATLGPALRERLFASFQTWEKCIRQVLQQAQEGGELDPGINVKDAAGFLIDAYEGALIRMKSEGAPASFGRFKTFALEPLLSHKPRPEAPAQVKRPASPPKERGRSLKNTAVTHSNKRSTARG
jgi:TetR/AcrR family transcriptional repressor of nem operon